MSDGSALLTILSGALALVLGTATFFIQKWIALVDETLKEHNSVIYKVSAQVSTLQSVQGRSAENITEELQSQGRDTRIALAKLPEIRKEIEIIKDVLQTKVLPLVGKEQLGKVVVLEKNQVEQGKLITKLYETIKLIIEKSSHPK